MQSRKKKKPLDLSPYVTFKVASIPSCCGVVLLHNFSYPYMRRMADGTTKPPIMPSKGNFNQRVIFATHRNPDVYREANAGDYRGRSAIAQAITNGGQREANKALRGAGFRPVAKAKNPNGSVLTFWVKKFS